jgi:hypothetical protein
VRIIEGECKNDAMKIEEFRSQYLDRGAGCNMHGGV